MSIIKAAFRIIIGGIFGIVSALALSPMLAAFLSGPTDKAMPWFIWGFILLCGVIGFFAPTIRRAFGRGFLVLGASTFALPLTIMLVSGRVASDMMGQSTTDAARAGTAIGAGIAGTIMTGAGAFIGFFLGSIFLIIGLVLVLGGRREVIVVNQRA